LKELQTPFGDETMARRSVTITGAWIAGGIAGVGAILAAVITAVPAYLSLRSPAVERPAPGVGLGSTPDSNGVGIIDAQQIVVTYEGSFQDYLGKLAALKDRNLERQEFLHSMGGKCVVWRGWVQNVMDIKGIPVVSITASRKGSILDGVGVRYSPAEWRTRLYALRNGDQVEIKAIYEGSDLPLIPVLRGLSISLVDAK
jgi:hypothetical protein